ncbi:hypothetical protein H7F33_13480 [Pedobacter sp. PAMC26386]|nr:hypothetical protein H7F33_13480 [Pedobacter sp. PAMC26386]
MKKTILFICITLLFVSCQEKLKENRNDKASIPESFGFEAMKLKTITTFIDSKAQTTSTLFGNQEAYETMKNTSAQVDGVKKLILVSWKLEEDPKWFGAMVPGGLLSIEELASSNFFNTDLPIQYDKLEGRSLKKNGTISAWEKQNRINLILSLKPAVAP